MLLIRDLNGLGHWSLVCYIEWSKLLFALTFWAVNEREIEQSQMLTRIFTGFFIIYFWSLFGWHVSDEYQFVSSRITFSTWTIWQVNGAKRLILKNLILFKETLSFHSKKVLFSYFDEKSFQIELQNAISSLKFKKKLENC